MNCKRCKWWKDSESLIDYKPVKICDYSDDFNRDGRDKLFEIEVDAADDTNLGFQLLTGPDFGCIHFKEKSNAD